MHINAYVLLRACYMFKEINDTSVTKLIFEIVFLFKKKLLYVQ